MLIEAGLSLDKSTSGSIKDVSFIDGVLTLAHIQFSGIYASTAFELRHDLDTEVISFLMFMDCLIDMGKDVAFLRKEDIIVGWRGSNDDLAALFQTYLKNPWAFISLQGGTHLVRPQHCTDSVHSALLLQVK